MYKIDEAFRERRPPWPRKLINPILPSVLINQVCSNLTICIIQCRDLVAKDQLQSIWIITCNTIRSCWNYYCGRFAHLLILVDPCRHQNLISSSLYHPNPYIKFHSYIISSKTSIQMFLSNIAYKQTNKNQRYQKHN